MKGLTVLITVLISLNLSLISTVSAQEEHPAPALSDYTVRKSDNPTPPVAPDDLNQCFAFEDVNYPDYPNNAVVTPGATVTKHLVIVNNCQASTAGMKAVRIAGHLHGPDEIVLPDIAPNGGRETVTFDITAPSDLPPGVYSIVFTVFTSDGQWANGFWTDLGIQ